ncbi:hypothetical protein OPV22_032421 [Ensete ventricosum]|uniref:H15 domain-containing protein n=1 Tax=Ensete ventricosum TaxID=4639 RepID=A0AAV8PXB0_ENSVE|nr:hypothetical protein OPV22_032421 [Ensete ventricosum]
MFATAVRWMAKKPKPKMKPIEPRTPPEQTQTITRAIFDVVKEHGPLTIADTWDHLKGVGLRGLNSKRQMKILLRIYHCSTPFNQDILGTCLLYKIPRFLILLRSVPYAGIDNNTLATFRVLVKSLNAS